MWRNLALLCLALVTVLAWDGPSASADIGMGETTAGSDLWEVNRDASGMLYVSDYGQPAIVVVNPTTGAYTRYTFSLGASFYITPSDAKPDANGAIWWSDYFSAFGRINPNTAEVTYWDVSALSLQPGGFAFDTSGRVWLTQRYKTDLLRFDPTNNQLCRFTVGGGGNYVIAYGGKLWIGDAQARRILRFDPGTNQLRWWSLPSGSVPEGLAFDADGRLWWADANLSGGKLWRLSPDTSQAVSYLLPGSTTPQPFAVVPGVEVIWYSNRAGDAGFLDPARATGSASTLATDTSTFSPTCFTVSSATQSTTKSTGTFTFPTVNWTAGPTQPGITTYTPPTTSPLPYGITFSDGRTWVTDQIRQTLSRTPRVPRAPTVSISLSGGNLTLAWPAVNKDEGGESITVTSYEVWRGSQPYFRPWDSGVTFVGATASTSFPVGSAPSADQSAFFAARSVADSGLLSRTSAHVGAFSYALTPGSAP